MDSSLPPPPAVRAAPPAHPRSAGTLATGWHRTFSSLSNPHFRVLWLSMCFSFTAIQMSFIAQGFLTYDLTGSATALGLVGLGWGAAQITFTPIGGVAADRLHKRWVIIISHCVMMSTSLLTAVLIQTDTIEVWHIFMLGLVGGTVFSFNIPARQAWIPELVGKDELMNAVALNTSAFTATGIVGPAIAGGLLGVPFIGLKGAYILMAACFAVTVLLLLRLPGGAPSTGRTHPHPYRALLDGLRYVRGHNVLPILILMGFVPIVIGMPYRSFFPVYQEEVYGVSEVWLGAMGATAAVGALIGSLSVAALTNTAKRSAIQLVGGLAFGVMLIVFAAAPSLPLGLLALLFVGLASNGYWALNNTMVLGNTDPEFYGRVMSVYMLGWSFSSFASLPEGRLADAIGVQTMTAGVGVVLIVALLAVVLLLPGHRRLREHEGRQIEAAAGG